MTFGFSVNTGQDDDGLTYTDTDKLHSGVLLKHQFIEILDDFQPATHNYVDIDFTAESAGFSQFAFAVIATGCSANYGNPGYFWWYGGWPNMWNMNLRSPTVTLSGTVLRVQSNSEQWTVNPDFTTTGIKIYMSYNVLVLGIK